MGPLFFYDSTSLVSLEEVSGEWEGAASNSNIHCSFSFCRNKKVVLLCLIYTYYVTASDVFCRLAKEVFC